VRITVRVPATSANLGPGFDCFGLALDLCNEVFVDTEGEPGVSWEGEGADELPTASVPVFSLHGANRIPLARGLGSSAAAAVTGVQIARVLLGPDVQPASLSLIRATDEPAPHRCVFLVTLDDGFERCGIHPQRPYVCRTYPARFRHGSVAIRDDVLCPPDAWNISGLDLPAWRLTMLRQELEWTVYAYVVSRWNATVTEPVADAAYFAWLLDVYGRLEAMRAELEPDVWDETVRRWLDVSGSSPAPAFMERVVAVMSAG